MRAAGRLLAPAARTFGGGMMPGTVPQIGASTDYLPMPTDWRMVYAATAVRAGEEYGMTDERAEQ
jgi:hypothetical protein